MLCSAVLRCVSANIILETVEDLLPQHLGADHEHAISIWVYLKFPGDRRLRKNLHMAVFLSVDLVAFHFIRKVHTLVTGVGTETTIGPRPVQDIKDKGIKVSDIYVHNFAMKSNLPPGGTSTKFQGRN